MELESRLEIGDGTFIGIPLSYYNSLYSQGICNIGIGMSLDYYFNRIHDLNPFYTFRSYHSC